MPELLDIIGQDRAISQLQRAMNGRRMPHGFLFVGPIGVGRRTTAVALARAGLCENPVSIQRSETQPPGRFPELAEDFPLRQGCGHCADCKMMDAQSHPDFHMVYKELARYHEDANVRDRKMQELGIDVIESFLIRVALRSPSRGRGKVFVVREADLMSDAAQNALLKTLEEPPPGVRIILIAETPQQMLPTTVSRCSVVPFNLLPREFVAQRLSESGMAAGEARFWADFTGASLGRAISLSQAGMYEIKRDVIARLASMNAGGDAELGEHLAKTAEKLADSAVKAAKEADGSDLSKPLATRRTSGAMLELIASAYVDAMHLRCRGEATAPPAQPLVHADQESAVIGFSRRFAPAQLAEIIEQISEYEQLLWRNVNAKTIWDNVVITCASAAPLRL